MPVGTKVHRCVKKVARKKGKNGNAVSKSAIRICQKATGRSYKTGQRPKKGRRR